MSAISGTGRLRTYDLRDICERLGIPYAPDLKLAAVLAEAMKRAGLAGQIQNRTERNGNGL